MSDEEPLEDLLEDRFRTDQEPSGDDEQNDDRDGPDEPDESGSPTGGTEAHDDEAVPLSDLARRVTDRESGQERPPLSTDAEGEATDAGDGPFEEPEVSEIDEETLWSALEGAEDPTADVGLGEPAERVTATEPEDPEYVVSKEKYCQSCPHLSSPPELTCTHEGTRIVEVVDTERFRVRNCPIVTEEPVVDEE